MVHGGENAFQAAQPSKQDNFWCINDVNSVEHNWNLVSWKCKQFNVWASGCNVVICLSKAIFKNISWESLEREQLPILCALFIINETYYKAYWTWCLCSTIENAPFGLCSAQPRLALENKWRTGKGTTEAYSSIFSLVDSIGTWQCWCFDSLKIKNHKEGKCVWSRECQVASHQDKLIQVPWKTIICTLSSWKSRAEKAA